MPTKREGGGISVRPSSVFACARVLRWHSVFSQGFLHSSINNYSLTFLFAAVKLEDTGCTRSVIDQTDWYWQKARKAVLQGNLQNPVLKNKGRWNAKRASKTPVENTQEDEENCVDRFARDVVRTSEPQPIPTKQIFR